MLKEFLAFLKQYGVIGLAIAVVIGGKANDLVKAAVDDILMPIVTLALPSDTSWQAWGVQVGSQQLKVGHLLGVGLDFLIVAFLVFWFSKVVLKEQEVSKK